MKLLIDQNPKDVHRTMERYDFISGQFCTPLTNYADAEVPYAIDNGCFSRFPQKEWLSLLSRHMAVQDRCLFVCLPDVVGSARRTLETFDHWYPWMVDRGWPVALVAQDGCEDLDIPWGQVACVFIGGGTEWKMSQAAADVVRAGLICGKHVHIGRVNTPERWLHFEKLGANTCDGSGVSRYDHMLDAIQQCRADGKPMPLFTTSGGAT